MKKIVITILSLFIALSSPTFAREEISQIQEEIDEIYHHPGNGDGAYTALASSMLGWGFGLATVIAVLVLALNANGN